MSEAGTPRRRALDPYEEERQHLERVQDVIRQALASGPRMPVRDEDDEDADEALTADVVADVAVAEMAEQRRHQLRRAMREPYFGRIDFQPEGESPLKLYIGKQGLDHPSTGERVVLDWRAPAASVFYSFNGQGDEARYEAPGGEVRGTVSLKRNIVVRDGDLVRVVDSYVKGQTQAGAVDEFLLYRLADAKDSRLHDIVATIQAEQNEVIRADKNVPILIQGVAGSGKTTVALHRLAYLLYQDPDKLRADRMVIFAPSAMFVDYISEVLPELGVGDVQQTTFAAFALRVLDYVVLLGDPAKRLRERFALRPSPAYEQLRREIELKGRVETVDALEAFLRDIEKDMVPACDVPSPVGPPIPAETVRRWFHTEYARYPVRQRRDRVLARVKRQWEMQAKQAGKADRATKRQMQTLAREYERAWPDLEPLPIYEAFLARHPGLSLASIQRPAKYGARPLVEPEDLPLLLVIHRWLHGVDARDVFQHVVIDEAQDFSPAHIRVLQAYCPSLSFTILGDLSQSIHSEAGFRDWEEVRALFPECRYVEMSVSYRSTHEIVTFANRILEPFHPKVLATPVFRSGDPVIVEPVAWEHRFERLVERLSEENHRATTIAVLTRTEEDAHVYHQMCLESGLDAHLLTAAQTQYEGGISVVPVYLAKGLEFDSVIVVDADASHYGANERDAKLLYVGCTRALHRLRLYYCDRPSPLIAWAVAN
ncbi:HelD family protein [Alicyclobacillus vulcanalis]|uniref:DNA helicase-2 / ATP-dependent DNA helicase PcrA n=1 Tax=Alicyclobacillus vulcanalis TaxID=252246 RepID=A0A1N7M3W8_9BACL|nr:3'-5' exonuclease [Alicyclobacillus vulcanalis]SIS80669.1 DNA helicase-2 / ATP-dependent DNA helicase PcrA [Alicyclobacillus vulcanalis]